MMAPWKKLVAIVGLLALLSPVCAQVTHRDLLKGFTLEAIGQALPEPGRWHPFPTSPAEWRRSLPDSIISQYIARGERASKGEFPDLTATEFLLFYRTKNRTEYERLNFARRNQLLSLVLAESMEGKGRFNDKIANAVWAICEESFWGLPAHITGLPDVQHPYVDLFAAETAALLAWTDYFMKSNLDSVSLRLRSRISYEVTRRIFDPLTKTAFGWMGGGDPNAKLNNWAPWIMSNYVTSSLLLEKDPGKRAAAIKKGIEVIDQYLNGLGDDGACDEGPHYWNAAAGCVFDALAVLHDASAGKLDIYREPFLRNVASYIYKMHIAGKYFVNVADAAAKLDLDGFSVFSMGKAIQDPAMMSFGSWTARNSGTGITQSEDRMFSRKFFSLLDFKECMAFDHPFAEQNDVWMSGIQMMCSRSANGFFVASHGGNNGESHNHNDVGDFIVYLNGRPLILDAGRGTYTGRTFSSERYKLWFNTSAYHNLPMIGGIEQKDGARYAARDVAYSSGEKESSLSMDIAGAYPPEAGVEEWKRTVTLHKAGWVEIRDAYVLKKDAPVTQTLMTVCQVDIGRPGVILLELQDKSAARLEYDASVWEAEVQPVVLNEPEDEEIKRAWEGQTIYRVKLRSKKNLAKGVSTLRIRKVG